MMKKNNLCPQDQNPLDLQERLKEEKVKAYASLSVQDRIRYFNDHNIHLEPYHLDRVRKLLSDERRFSDNFYPKPKGPLNVNHLILGEIHDAAENWEIYSTLFKGLVSRGYTNLTFEFSNSKDSQDRLNEAFLLTNAKDDSLSLEDRMFTDGAVPALVHAIQNNMRITFVDSMDRGASLWDREIVPNVPFNPDDPNTIIDEESVINKAKLDSEILHNRNLHIASGISAFDQEKVVHIGGRDHNKGLQSLLEQKTGLTPLSLLIDYPSRRVTPEELENDHAYSVEYVRDIFTLVDNLTESAPSKNLGAVPLDAEDSPGSETSPNRVRAYLLSGLVGQIMSKAASLSKGSPEHQSRIFMSMLVALTQVSVLDIDLGELKASAFKKEKNNEVKEKEKHMKREKEEEKKKKRLKELEQRLEEEEVKGSDIISIFNVFQSLLSLPTVVVSQSKNPMSVSFGSDSSFNPTNMGKWIMEESGINPKSYFSDVKLENIDVDLNLEIA